MSYPANVAYRMLYDELTPERQIQQSDKEKIQNLQEQLDQEKKSHVEKIQCLEDNYKLVPSVPQFT